MTDKQKIGCNVSNCTHNNSEKDTCILDRIQVTTCGINGNRTPEDETACGMYSYSAHSDGEETKKDKEIKKHS